jgi:anti-anti-sigma factor
MNRTWETAPLLRIEAQGVGRRAVLTAVGEVDISTAADLRRALETARDDGAAEIWLDFTRTTFMDFSGLRVVVAARASLKEAERRLVLICPEGPVLRLLALTGVGRELEIHPTRAAAHYAN